MRPITILLAAAAAALSAASAEAQDDTADDAGGATADILGVWAFDAYPTYPGCQITGEARISPGPDPDTYQCTLTATDLCPGVWRYVAEQSCSATRDGDSLSIKSSVLNVEPPTDLYLPDNFILEIVNGALMVGELNSAVDAKAQFYRTDGPIS